jgi:hypothetical protein
MLKLRICNQCGWAHFPRKRSEVEDEARNFGNYIKEQTPEVQDSFGLGPLRGKEWSFEEHVQMSEKCFKCGNSYKNFRDENNSDNIPSGCTLQGIIVES